MPEPLPAPRLTLRALPFPAKVVITLFLLTVGLGYSSAMVQMHFQHTQGDGSPLPGPNDVIEIFAGKKWLTKDAIAKNRPVSKIEKLVTGPIDGPLNGGGSMGSAFFKNDRSEAGNRFKDAITKRAKEEVEVEREGERTLMVLWVNAPKAERAKAYADNRFAPAKDKAPAKMSPEYIHNDGGFLIQNLFRDRCASCHRDGAQAGNFPLTSYEQIAKYAECAPGAVIPEGQDGAWCASDRQISKEKLAQSTHAHLLSFAMLFALTGLVFSFSSYPFLVRLVLGPIVLLAQVADVSCWWLARIDGPGIYFAQAIIATGAVVGLGLGAQIILSVFNMYGKLGKVVLAMLFAAAFVGIAFLAKTVILPELQAQKAKKKQAAAVVVPKVGPKVEGQKPPPPPDSPSLEKLLTGQWSMELPWGPDKAKNPPRVPDSGMVRAFFDRDADFKDAMKEKGKEPQAFVTMKAEREGEQNAILAWIRSKPEDRKKSFEKDEFPLPAELQGKPMTAEFQANDKAVKVRSILDTRCYSCHGAGTKIELDSYEKLEKFMK
ncbi:MAG TPA: hypothetical protein VN641_18305 [Urbifossiella sp.]|nr:hypothetical protein [Urbifossiella sp.]